MTDGDIFHELNNSWKPENIKWENYVKTISDKHLIQYIKYEKLRPQYYINEIRDDMKELLSRDIPEDLKLEVLLLIGDCNDR